MMICRTTSSNSIPSHQLPAVLLENIIFHHEGRPCYSPPYRWLYYRSPSCRGRLRYLYLLWWRHSHCVCLPLVESWHELLLIHYYQLASLVSSWYLRWWAHSYSGSTSNMCVQGKAHLVLDMETSVASVTSSVPHHVFENRESSSLAVTIHWFHHSDGDCI